MKSVDARLGISCEVPDLSRGRHKDEHSLLARNPLEDDRVPFAAALEIIRRVLFLDSELRNVLQHSQEGVEIPITVQGRDSELSARFENPRELPERS